MLFKNTSVVSSEQAGGCSVVCHHFSKSLVNRKRDISSCVSQTMDRSNKHSGRFPFCFHWITAEAQRKRRYCEWQLLWRGRSRGGGAQRHHTVRTRPLFWFESGPYQKRQSLFPVINLKINKSESYHALKPHYVSIQAHIHVLITCWNGNNVLLSDRHPPTPLLEWFSPDLNLNVRVLMFVDFKRHMKSLNASAGLFYIFHLWKFFIKTPTTGKLSHTKRLVVVTLLFDV